jgi:hypothetical protein
MTAFCSHQDRLHELAGVSRSPVAASSRQEYAQRLGALVRDAVSRTIAAFGSRADWSLEPAAHGNRDQASDAAKFPQRPLILGDKWDF